MTNTNYSQLLREYLGDGKKYFIRTYGCQMNEHDSEIIEYMLEDSGYKRTEDVESSDLILLNTCAIRGTAEDKVFGFLGSLKGLKKKNPNLKIIVSGCMPQLEESLNNFKNNYGHVDILMGASNYQKLPELIYNSMFEKNMIVDITDGYDYQNLNYNFNRLYRHKSFVNIIYGCNNFCSYCVVPYTRGRERSREFDEIVDEIKLLAEDGVKEVTLLGQNVNSYGKNLTVKRTFSDLLREINDIDGIERIRFMTSHPKDISDELINSYKELDKLANHLHLPVQSGSNKVLKEMNRKYTVEKYLDIIEKIKKINPDISLTTDIIVGFPGETDEDFEYTLKLVKEVEYDSVFTFLYSPRTGTPASIRDDQVPYEIKKDRFERLNQTINEIALKKNQKYLGKTVKVLVDEVSKNDDEYLSGRTDTFKLVNFKADKSLIGEILDVKIEKVNTFTLDGKLL